MKKFFFLTAAATMLFAACQKTEVVYNEGPQEIAMFAVNNLATKDPVTSTTFPTNDDMQVVAYLADGGTAGDYFGATVFGKTGTNWVGGKYWPITGATINFLAVSQPEGAAPVTTTFPETPYASKAVVTLNDNSTEQYDLMYAFGQGKKVEGETPAAVDMVFKHALSLIAFKVKAAEGATITVKSITLDKANYSGKLTLTNSSYNATGAVATANVSPAWSDWSSLVENKSVFSGSQNCTNSAVACGTETLVVPNNETLMNTAGFTVTYSIDNSSPVVYSAKFGSPDKWEAGKKYTYEISFGAADPIEIAPSVDLYVTENGIVVDGDPETNGDETQDDITVNVQ